MGRQLRAVPIPGRSGSQPLRSLPGLNGLSPAARQGGRVRAPLAAVPDAELIECLVLHGQPRWSAEQLRTNPQLRFHALKFWVDVGDAAKGDPHAKERVDYCRESWSELRRNELIGDRPGVDH